MGPCGERRKSQTDLVSAEACTTECASGTAASQIAGSERARPEYTELVALRVRKNNPGLLALSYVRSRGSQREESLDLRVSVVRSEVKVQAILRRLRLSLRLNLGPIRRCLP